jgi:hypothetical protein
MLHMPPPEDRAELLRRDLVAVGVTRAALHIEHDPIQRAIVFHDLRDTGLTHMAVRGDSPVMVQWAGGHTDYKMTSGYVERGQTERRRIGDPLPPLPPGLVPSRNLGLVSDSSETSVPNCPFSLGNTVTPTGIECKHATAGIDDEKAATSLLPPEGRSELSRGADDSLGVSRRLAMPRSERADVLDLTAFRTRRAAGR